MTEGIDLEYQVELADGELIDLDLLVEYEMVEEQSDCGIMREYPEVTGVEIYNEEYKNNVEVLKYIEDKMSNINDKVDDLIFYN